MNVTVFPFVGAKSTWTVFASVSRTVYRCDYLQTIFLAPDTS